MIDDSGHLFVVHGRIETLSHDAAVVPVGTSFHFSDYWSDLVGATPRKPDRWNREGWGRVFDCPDRVWAVSIGKQSRDSYSVVLDRVEHCLASISSRRTAHRPKRGPHSRPLVALPVIGIGRGGHGQDRGGVLRALVERMHTAAVEHDVDIAVVTPDPAVYAAAQFARPRLSTALSEDLEAEATALGKQAREGELALFLGAGVAVPAGLPTWDELVARLASKAGVDYLASAKDHLSVTDQAELIEKAAEGRFQYLVADEVKPHRHASLLHGLLAGLGCREAVTTNYDVLYESAIRATGRSIDSVLPWSSAAASQPWVLKLHGDVDHPKSIVLTRRHMVMYDALNRPSGALLQSLLLTRNILFVGASMSDDNVIRLAHEVQKYRTDHQGEVTRPFGTVLDVDGNDVRARLWDGQLNWVSLADREPGSGFRRVEIMLDRIAFHAARNSSWLLDARFEGLLKAEDIEFARKVRALYGQRPGRPDGKWGPLLRRLEEMGVRGM